MESRKGTLLDCGAGSWRYELGERAWVIAPMDPTSTCLSAVRLTENPVGCHEALCAGRSVEEVTQRLDEVYGAH